MNRLLYSLAIYGLLPVLFGYFFWRSLREPAYRQGWLQRFGLISRIHRPCLWLHAASVGEAQAAMPLIARLIEANPGHRLVVTSFTPTGAALVRQRFGERVAQVYLPVDTPGAVRRFLDRLRPEAGIIIETELWPNLLLACRSSGIPMLLASASLSPDSLQRYYRFPGKALMARALQAFDCVAAQTTADEQRLVKLGVAADRIRTLGNLKFDLAVPENLFDEAAAMRRQWHADKRPIWVVASTHEGEEAMILDAFTALLADQPTLLLILAPRHPQRFDAVASLIETRKLSFLRRSDGADCAADTQVLLLDTLGELMQFYALGDVVFVGGSLVPIGGHNLLEPAALGRPVITGPYCESQQQLCDLLQAQDALLRVGDHQALQQAVEALLADTGQRSRMGEAARSVVAGNSGVLQRLETEVQRLLHPDSASEGAGRSMT